MIVVFLQLYGRFVVERIEKSKILCYLRLSTKITTIIVGKVVIKDMTIKDDFEFLNSEIWLKYSQARYAPLDDIRYRLEKLGHDKQNWKDLRAKIQKFRKVGSIPLFIESINKNFWFFPADCITKKISEVEHLGNKLYEKIDNYKVFKEDFISNAAIEEAVTSAIYEGANTTRSKAKQLIASKKAPKGKDEWMLINNYFAMKWIKDNTNKSVNKELVLQLHAKVTKNTLEGDDANFSGKYRNDTVFVGPHEGIDFQKVEDTINEVIQLTTNNKRFLHSLLKGILLHYFIAYIHPFFDGNGRTARTLFYFKAMKNDLKFIELLSVSAQLKEHGKKYKKAFELVKGNDFDITYFIDFCLESLINALKKVQQKVTYLFEISSLVDSLKLNKSQVGLLQRMALHKYRAITIEEHALNISKSREISRRELKDLLAKKLLREEKIGKKFIYFVESNKLRELVAAAQF